MPPLFTHQYLRTNVFVTIAVPSPRLQTANANHLAPGKVRPALSLVGNPDEVAELITFMFNDALICDDTDGRRRGTERVQPTRAGAGAARRGRAH
jgi:chromosome segregation ATPase